MSLVNEPNSESLHIICFTRVSVPTWLDKRYLLSDGHIYYYQPLRLDHIDGFQALDLPFVAFLDSEGLSIYRTNLYTE